MCAKTYSCRSRYFIVLFIWDNWFFLNRSRSNISESWSSRSWRCRCDGQRRRWWRLNHTVTAASLARSGRSRRRRFWSGDIGSQIGNPTGWTTLPQPACSPLITAASVACHFAWLFFSCCITCTRYHWCGAWSRLSARTITTSWPNYTQQ